MLPLWILATSFLLGSSLVPGAHGFLKCGKCERASNSLTCPNSMTRDRYDVQIDDYQGAPEKVFHVRCMLRAKSVDYSLIEGCNFPEVQYVIFERCPRPNVTFSEVLRKTGIDPGKVVAFTLMSVFTQNEYEDGEDLEEWHFEGFHNLTSLKFRGNNFQSLPPNILDYTPKLTYFQFSYNNLETISENLFRNTPNLKTIHLYMNRFHHLPDGLFNGLNEIKNISLWGNELKEIGPNLFSNLSTLWSLELTNNNIQSVDPEAFVDLTGARKILLSDNEIENIPEELFSNCTELMHVGLNENKLTSIPPGLFAGLDNMYSIEFSSNMITSLSDDLFAGLGRLGKLKMKRNLLKSLSPDMISDSPKLEILDIQSNILEELPPGIFDNQHIMDRLILKNNSLTTLPDGIFKNCAGLQDLFLSHNKFSKLESSWFPTPVTVLKTLDLMSNNISFTSYVNGQEIAVERTFPLLSQVSLEYISFQDNKITAIPQSLSKHFVNLTKLNMAGNEIEYLDTNDLIFKNDEVTISLEDNKIKTINLHHIQNIPRYKTIILYLKGNPFVCDCNLYVFLRLLQKKNIPGIEEVPRFQIKNIDRLICSYPDDETRKNMLLFLNSEKLICQDQDCPRGCQCFTRSHDEMYVVDCAYQNLHELPRISMQNNTPSNYHLTMNLRNNSISNLDRLQEPEYQRLLNLTIPNNSLTSLNESNFPESLKILDIRGNNFTYLEKSILDYFNETDLTLSLGDNPWVCDCELVDLQSFLRIQEMQVTDFYNIRCINVNETLVDVSKTDLCPLITQPRVIILSTMMSLVLLLAGVLVTVGFWKYRQEIKVWLFTHRLCLWAVTNEEYDNNKKYDAFISYSEEDGHFVNSVLLPKLESGDPKYKVCIDYRDWQPGAYIQQQIDQSIEASRRTIVILSSNFIENVWGHLEFKAAHCQALKDRRNRIIVIVLGEVPPENELDEELKLYLSTRTYLQVGDSKFWEKLRYAMPHPIDLISRKARKRKDTDKLELVKSISKESK